MSEYRTKRVVCQGKNPRKEKALEKTVAGAEFKDFMAMSGFGIRWKPKALCAKFPADGAKEMGALTKEVGLVR
jgi:hypothetical protein